MTRSSTLVPAVGIAILLLGSVWLGGCTATDSSSGPRATPQPPTTATPVPSPGATSAPEAPEPEDSATSLRPRIDDLLALPVPLNIARAGGDLLAPGSTLFAMSRAVEEGATMLELDVTLTVDGVLVIHESESVAGPADTTSLVSDLTLEELRALDSAFWFAEGCQACTDLPVDDYLYRGISTGLVSPPTGFRPEDFRTPTLTEVIERFPTMAFDIEIPGTSSAGFAIAQALATRIREADLTDHTVVRSTDDEVVGLFEVLAPRVETSPGDLELSRWLFGGEPLDASHRIVQVPPSFAGVSILTASFWQQARNDSTEVWVWMDDRGSQESLEFYQILIAQGADGIIAGRPNEMAAATS